MEQCFLLARKLDSKLARCRALFITFVPAARRSVPRTIEREKIRQAGIEDRASLPLCVSCVTRVIYVRQTRPAVPLHLVFHDTACRE